MQFSPDALDHMIATLPLAKVLELVIAAEDLPTGSASPATTDTPTAKPAAKPNAIPKSQTPTIP